MKNTAGVGRADAAAAAGDHEHKAYTVNLFYVNFMRRQQKTSRKTTAERHLFFVKHDIYHTKRVWEPNNFEKMEYK